MKSIRYLLGKSMFSSFAGWPIAFIANLTLLPFFADMLIENVLLAAILIGVMFGLISVVRLFIIDYVEDRYSLNIRPDHLIRKIIDRLK